MAVSKKKETAKKKAPLKGKLKKLTKVELKKIKGGKAMRGGYCEISHQP